MEKLPPLRHSWNHGSCVKAIFPEPSSKPGYTMVLGPSPASSVQHSHQLSHHGPLDDVGSLPVFDLLGAGWVLSPLQGQASARVRNYRWVL